MFADINKFNMQEKVIMTLTVYISSFHEVSYVFV